jgi:hypothetical protein
MAAALDIRHDPVSALIAALRKVCAEARITDVRPEAGMLDDDGLFDLPTDLALMPFGLLPVLVEAGRLVYAEAWFDRVSVRPFPFVVEQDEAALMGVKAAPHRDAVSFEIGILCCTDALLGFIERSPPTGNVLELKP